MSEFLSENKLAQNKSGKIGLLIIIFCILLVLGLISYYLFSGSMLSSKPQNNAAKKSEQPATKNNVSSFPINPDNPDVEGAKMTYTMSLNIDDIRDAAGGAKEIMATSSIKNLPKLLVNPNTEVMRNFGGKLSPTTAGALKKGDKIRIVLDYKIKSKRWSLVRVTILNSSAPANQSSPSGTVSQ